MSDSPQVDLINQPAMRSAVQDYADLVPEGLNAAERAALEVVRDRMQGKRILDLGVGAGRTVAALTALSPEYVGVDYAPEMVAHCRAAFPGVRFEQADARALPFADASFDLVVFSCNGISMVDHRGRLAILAEVRRLLAPDGVLLFSTCNRNSPEFESGFRYPAFSWSWNPAKCAARVLRFGRDTLLRLRNRRRFKPQEVVTSDYAIVNDIYHHYGVMLYFISLEQQLKQLALAGFRRSVTAFDLTGRIATAASRDVTLTFVTQA